MEGQGCGGQRPLWHQVGSCQVLWLQGGKALCPIKLPGPAGPCSATVPRQSHQLQVCPHSICPLSPAKDQICRVRGQCSSQRGTMVFTNGYAGRSPQNPPVFTRTSYEKRRGTVAMEPGARARRLPRSNPGTTANGPVAPSSQGGFISQGPEVNSGLRPSHKNK